MIDPFVGVVQQVGQFDRRCDAQETANLLLYYDSFIEHDVVILLQQRKTQDAVQRVRQALQLATA